MQGMNAEEQGAGGVLPVHTRQEDEAGPDGAFHFRSWV